MNALRSYLYLLARLIGDFQAARRGPRAIMLRIGRKAVLREAGRTVNRIR